MPTSMVHPMSGMTTNSAQVSPWHSGAPSFSISPTSTFDYTSDGGSMGQHTRASGKRRVRDTSNKAVALMESAINDTVIDGYNSELEKSGTDKLRERGATLKAAAMWEKAVQPIHTTPKEEGAKTARQAAQERYQAHKKEKYETKRVLHELKKNNPAPGVVKKLVVEKPLETMATSTRKTNKYAKAMEDPESVENEKCTLSREMEDDARKKALKLLDFIHESGSDGYEII